MAGAFEIEEVDDEEFALINESPITPVIDLAKVKYDEFWSDLCWSDPSYPVE